MLNLLAKRIAERGEIILTVQMPQAVFKMLGDMNNIKVGDTVTSTEEIRMKH